MTGNLNELDYTFNAVSSGSVNETTTRYPGRGSALTATVEDYDGNSSTLTITLNQGHGLTAAAAGGNGTVAAAGATPVLNVISGTAVE